MIFDYWWFFSLFLASLVRNHYLSYLIYQLLVLNCFSIFHWFYGFHFLMKWWKKHHYWLLACEYTELSLFVMLIKLSAILCPSVHNDYFFWEVFSVFVLYCDDYELLLFCYILKNLEWLSDVVQPPVLVQFLNSFHFDLFIDFFVLFLSCTWCSSHIFKISVTQAYGLLEMFSKHLTSNFITWAYSSDSSSGANLLPIVAWEDSQMEGGSSSLSRLNFSLLLSRLLMINGFPNDFESW